MATNNSGKVALFIEWVVTGESITVLALEGIMREATKLGEVTQRRFYGSGTNIEQLAEALAHHSIIAIETTVRKANQRGLCTDSAMIIDIMDLLHKDCFDWFCIASAGDCREYIRLVERIRRDGRVKVFGFGAHDTIENFKRYCDYNFQYLVDVCWVDEPGSPARQQHQTTSAPAVSGVAAHATLHKGLLEGGRWPLPVALKRGLSTAIRQAQQSGTDKDDWVNLELVQKRLSEMFNRHGLLLHLRAQYRDLSLHDLLQVSGICYFKQRQETYVRLEVDK